MRFVLPLVFICSTLAEQTPSPTENPSGIEGVINVSPAHGGPERVGVPNSRPLANTEFVVSNESGTAASFKTDEQGRFRVSLGAGRYSVSRKGAAKGIGRCGPFEVDVVGGQFAKVEWMCDSGMR
jgi:hypothetical protein